jgi:predicted phage terminase large subunit-like protein
MVSIDSLAGLLKPKLSKFTPHSPFAKQLAFLMLPHDEALYGGALGGGKVLYNDGEILTPFGFMKGSDLKVGQNVCNPDGSVCQIIQLHPEQNFKVWKVTFDDGTSTEVSKEHLWNAWAIGKSTKRCGKRLTGPNSAKVYETQELKKLIESGKRVRIPLCQPQKFNLPTKGKLIDPYVFGAWLGDGHTCINGSVGFTTSDKEHFSKYMVGGTWHKTNTADGWRWTGDSRKFWLKFLKQNSLDKAKSHSKFIPDKYKYSTLETRTNLLKGLMDTDGYIDKRGQCYYTSVSKQLAEDVAFVARSLGCYVKISIKKTTHKDAYELYIKHPKNICLFNLPRKIKRVKAKQFEPSKKIVSIEVLNKTKRGRCITVNHTNGLYITNDFIVTHNSDALLMAALQHVEVPGYSAMLLRKTLTDLKQSGALLDRMTNWMMPWLRTKEVRYEASTHKFYFPTYNSEGKRMIDSTIQFGYIGESNAYTRYQGIELNFCGFDEVTQHAKRDYEYLFTRLRKCVCPLHTERDANEDPIYHDDCESCQWAKSVPIRMRSTCNPDGIGFAWVKKRFEIGPDVSEEKAQEEGRDVRWIGHSKLRPFIPSTYKDNPFLDHKAYEKRLKKKLSDDLYEALVKGSWGVVANARFKKRWQRYYSRQGKILYMGPNFQGRILNFEDDIQDIFATVDSAATSDEGLGDVELYPNRIKNPSYTVICTWALTKCYNLLLLNMVRFRDEIPEVIAEVINQYQQWNPSVMIIEDNGVGKGVAQSVERAGVTVKGLFKDKDKVVNATEAILQMKNGRVWFPHPQPSWMSDFEDEVFTWQGHPQETDDIVDNLAHACNYVKWENAGQPHDYTSMIIQEMSEVPRAFFSPNRMIADGHQSSSSIIRWDH